jgi:hypothetical protein
MQSPKALRMGPQLINGLPPVDLGAALPDLAQQP